MHGRLAPGLRATTGDCNFSAEGIEYAFIACTWVHFVDRMSNKASHFAKLCGVRANESAASCPCISLPGMTTKSVLAKQAVHWHRLLTRALASIARAGCGDCDVRASQLTTGCAIHLCLAPAEVPQQGSNVSATQQDSDDLHLSESCGLSLLIALVCSADLKVQETSLDERVQQLLQEYQAKFRRACLEVQQDLDKAIQCLISCPVLEAPCSRFLVE